LGRILDKREWAALVLLYDNGPSLNLGRAIDILREELCSSKKVAASIIRRLRRLGYLMVEKDDDEILVRVADPQSVLRSLVESYLEGRRYRCGSNKRS